MPDVQPISDDQELAKVLAGVSNNNSGGQPVPVDNSVSTLPPVSDNANQQADQTLPEPTDSPAAEQPAPVETMQDMENQSTLPNDSVASEPQGDLATIKADALQELRPLVDKLNVTPQEKFDVILLLLRSTDDSSLVEQAHTAAKEITDETARAQALLDVIKEIDFLSQPQQQ